MNSVHQYLEENQTAFQRQLFEFLRIPSVSTDPEHLEDIQKAAVFLTKQLKQAGLDQVQQFETDGNPIVYAEKQVDPSKPTVLIYGHYDVQPPDPLDKWHSRPFEPEIRQGRIYARGASDDKGQSFTHLKSVEAFLQTGTQLPVNVKFMFEGEEEIGSPSLVPFVRDHQDLLACDMVLISDTAMFDEGQPSITYGLRGLAYLEVEITGPNRDLHSGVYGGAVDNPANVLAGVIAKLKDEQGNILIDGFYDNVRPLSPEEREAYRQLPFDESRYRQALGLNRLHGEEGFTPLEQTTARPSLDVNGLWGGYQGEGAKTVLPSAAGAKISMRLVPDQTPDEIAKCFTEYVRKITPNTVTVEVREHHGGYPVTVDINFYGLKAAAKAFEKVYKKEVLFTREGGSIPIVADFKNVLGVNSILMGFGLSKDALHSPNESFSLQDFHKGIKTSAEFLDLLPTFQ